MKTNEKQGETYRFHCMYFGVRQNTASRDNNAYPSYFGNGNKSLGMLESIEVVRIGLEIEPLLLGTRELGVIAKFHYTRARTKRAREGSFVVLIGVRDRKNMFGSTACLYDRMWKQTILWQCWSRRRSIFVDGTRLSLYGTRTEEIKSWNDRALIIQDAFQIYVMSNALRIATM